MMLLNKLKPALGSKKKSRRVGRGIGCTLGKTSGKGHKGQKARAGGFHKIGFEGGQMPLQRRLPKIGFKSHQKNFKIEIPLSELRKFSGQKVDIKALQEAKIVASLIKEVAVIDSGLIDVPVIISGMRVTKGAKAKIEAVGGKVEV